MIYFIDFDFTIADTSITKSCSGNYKEKQKLIPQYKIYKVAVDFLLQNGIINMLISNTKAKKHFQ